MRYSDPESSLRNGELIECARIGYNGQAMTWDRFSRLSNSEIIKVDSKQKEMDSG